MQGLKLGAVMLAIALADSGGGAHAVYATPLTSQNSWSDIAMRVKPGEEMIAETHSSTRITGTFVAVNTNELILWVAGAAKRLDQSDIRTLTRVRTTRNRRGILIGAVAGAAVGFLSISDEEDFSARGRLVFALIGAGAGAAIGTAFSGRRTSKEIVYRAPTRSEKLATPLFAPAFALASRARCGESAAGGKTSGAMIRQASQGPVVGPISRSVSGSFGGGSSAGILACR